MPNKRGIVPPKVSSVMRSLRRSARAMKRTSPRVEQHRRDVQDLRVPGSLEEARVKRRMRARMRRR